MNTITLELTDDLARLLAAVPESDRNRFAIAALALGIDALTGLREDEEDPATIAEIGEALAEYQAGERGRPIDEFFTEMNAEFTRNKPLSESRRAG